MRDTRTLAYINLYAVLGAIPELLQYDGEARALAEGVNMSVCFSVRGGPCATLFFEGGRAYMRDGDEGCKIKIPFSSPEKFNGMIDGTVTPLPIKGIFHVGFLLGKFAKLTDILTKYLRPSDADLSDKNFRDASTRLLFGVICRAVCQIGNEDPVGRASASYVVDGVIKIAIAGDIEAGITAKDHHLSAEIGRCPDFRSYMIFRDIDTARDLFDGKINAVSEVGTGGVRIGGMISQIDNVNRMLDRVSMYLA